MGEADLASTGGRTFLVGGGRTGNALVTVIDVDPQRRGRGRTSSPEANLYAHVDAVNAALMRDA